MIDVSKAAHAVTHPVHTAGSIAGRTFGMTLGAAKIGVRTTVRVVGWAVEQAGGPTPQRPSDTYSSVTVPPATVQPTPEPTPGPTDLATPQPSDDPMRPTVTPPRKAPARTAPAKKVPASEVPLKSAPTPSLPAGLEALDAAVDDAPEVTPVPAPARKTAAKKAPAKKAPAKKTAAKKTAAKKTAAKKAPSEQAAVLAPALGLSESEVAEVVGDADDDA